MRLGKSYVAELQVEKALDQGRTVFIVTLNGATKKRRKRHLTSTEFIENLKSKDIQIPTDEF